MKKKDSEISYLFNRFLLQPLGQWIDVTYKKLNVTFKKSKALLVTGRGGL
jgi:hypothetical protein